MAHFSGNIEITIVDVIEVPPQYVTRQNPCCIVTLGSSGPRRFMEGTHFGKEKFQTQVFKGDLHRPAWNETHILNLDNMTLDSHLKVKLYDRDTVKDDFLGEVKISLDDLLPVSKKGLKYYPLCRLTKIMGANRQECVGQIGIAVAFDCTEIPQTYFDRKMDDPATRRIPGVNTGLQLQKPITQHDATSGKTDITSNEGTEAPEIDQTQPQQKEDTISEQTSVSQSQEQRV